jgi:hypothetical protein
MFAGARQRVHRPGDQPKQVIAGAVPERVVDELEVVKVDVQDRQAGARGQGAAQMAHQRPPARQPGELIPIEGAVQACRERAQPPRERATDRSVGHRFASSATRACLSRRRASGRCSSG